MKIGLYFGSFNPIHIGHLIIANHILNETSLDRLWFVVSPQNPLKPSATLLNEYDRLHLVQIAVKDDDRLKASEIEFLLPKPSYTSHTLAYLVEKYPSHHFTVIMGSDSFQNLPNWKNPDYILKHFPVLVYQRPGFSIEGKLPDNVTLLNAPLLEISATYIRRCIQEGKSIAYLVPRSVAEEIERSGFYRNTQKK